MATLQAATASSGAQVTDQTGVEELTERYWFGNLNWEVEFDTGEFYVWGYDTFLPYLSGGADEAADYDAGPQTREFLFALSEYLADGEELIIQSAGYTKCRFPVYARGWRVRRDGVAMADLSQFEEVESSETPWEPRR